MDFAPYQDTSPETVRALSPPPQRSSSRSPKPRSPPPGRPSTEPSNASSLPAPSHFSDEPHENGGFGRGNIEGGRLDVNLFETSLPLRLDYEAVLAYLLLPPAGGVLLLVLEHKSDYVRYVTARRERYAQGTLMGRIERFFEFSVLHRCISLSRLISSASFAASRLLFKCISTSSFPDFPGSDEVPFLW